MDNALGCSLVEQTACLKSCRISRSTVLGLYGLTDNADGGLKLRTNSAITHACLFVGDDSLFLTFNVRHVLSSV